MRNLKRALSLALASVMLLGMMVVGAGAASYPDVSAEDNVEAIEVLNAVGVMIGDRGNFRPNDGLNRHEMAVIMAKLMLGTEAADDYVGTHPFTDVVPWADKYVAACYNEGIISGTSATTYGGGNPLTAVQAAAMMLRALGYEDLSKNATDWRTPVAAKANEIRLFKDVVSSPSAHLTRNQVAQLALNTLKSDVVITSGQGGTVTTPDGTVVNLGNLKYDPIAESTYDYNEAGAGTHDGDYRQLIEKLYEDDLELADVPAGDDFGRPAHKWVYDGKDVITVADSADEVYVGEVTAEDLYDDLGLRDTIAANKVDVLVDGNAEAGDDTSKAITEDDDDTKFGADGQTVYAYYAKGDEAADDKVTLVVISSYLGVVTDDAAKSGDKTGIRIYVNGVSKFFETEAGYAEDDVVLLTMAEDEVKEITGTPKTVTGEVTRLGSDSAMTISGTKYPQAAQFDEADGDVIKGVADGSLEVSNSYTLYLDANGCYLAAVEVEDNTSTDLVYVFNAEASSFLNTSNNKVEDKVMATVVEMDGTYRDIAITYYNTDGTATKLEDGDSDDANAINDAFAGKLAYLTYDEDDEEYTLTTCDQYDGDYATEGLNASGFELKADDRNGKIGETSATTYYLNNKTVYIFVSVDDGDIDKLEIFTGGVDANIDADTEGAIAFESNKRVGYVVIEAAYSASADDVIYITSTTSKGTVKDGKLYKGYIVGEDTKEQEIAIQTGANGAEVIDAEGFYAYKSVKSSGNLDKLTKHAADAAGYVVGKTIASLVDGDGAFTDSANDDVYDFTKAVIVDLRDDTDVYGEIVSLKALDRAISRDYTITVSAYINGDDEVVGLFITDVAEPDGDDPDEEEHVHNLTWSEAQAAEEPTCTENGHVAYYTCTCSGDGDCDLDAGAKYASTNGDSTTDPGTALTDEEYVGDKTATGHTAIGAPGTTPGNYAHKWNGTDKMQHAVKCQNCAEAADANSWEDCSDGSDGDGVCNTCGQTNITTDPS